MNEAAIESLDALIARLNESKEIPTKAAPLVAAELDRLIRAQIAAGTAPDGTPWRLKKDGGKPLQNVTVSVKALGTSVVARLDGPAVRHNFGIAKGGIKRQILPDRKLPQPIIEAIKTVLAKVI